MERNLSVIVVAAGRGTRMGTQESKQFLELDGHPLFIRAIRAFERFEATAEIVVVTGAADVERCGRYIEEAGCKQVAAVVAGGAERQHSVYEGLKRVSAPWVMVHDGVRPFVRVEEIAACYGEMLSTGASVLAVPVKDTIKRVERTQDGGSGIIADTPDRSALWAIQTPQGFRTDDLRRAHERAAGEGFVGTDDSMLVERLGVPVSVTHGDYTNIKITTPEDLDYAEYRLLAERKGNKS
ncbi:2-C-methyl-D-erythritol 4-phosphate cytidylyltransferase [Saccharibacillus sp. CPCC 101409]|uniref:2-C-methyl-D-erythritol 4-phosphate cytidylyltransferase n=1 Tax=Saccharibacillus sp. CPCC 101409 TaxID=3058041 RepID=UPI002673EE9C|nr:2-C-methyl-D-erythritol 4-phosphate cytidylyltransferase [Saccharibacillus sp. CPCC 101409]MDO3412992.1 2-C-methyl-D-erythritol 4-phosphate cytidylyltransferase [Saccharibacillus sp. CPCC 101409]